MPVSVGHTETRDRIRLEIDLDQHGWIVPDDPAVVAGVDRYDSRRREFVHAPIGILDMNLSLGQEADVRVHTSIGFRDRLHVRRPAESWLIDDALHSRIAGAHGIHLHAADDSSLGIRDRSE
jgi:hypothetical protein